MLRHIAKTLLVVNITMFTPSVQAQNIAIETLPPIDDRVEQNSDAQQRIQHDQAEQGIITIIRGLDKINGHTQDVEMRSGTSAKVFGVLVTVQECRYPKDNPTGDAYAFLNIRDPKNGDVIFNGWMVASSPALNALDHRRYDIWVLRCKSS